MPFAYWLSTVVNRPSGRTPVPTNLGHRIQFRLTTSLKAYLIPPGYEAKMRPLTLLSYKEKRCFPLHEGNAGLFDSLRPRTNHFKTSCFPVFCLWRKRLTLLQCLLPSSIALWVNSRAHTFGSWLSSHLTQHLII